MLFFWEDIKIKYQKWCKFLPIRLVNSFSPVFFILWEIFSQNCQVFFVHFHRKLCSQLKSIIRKHSNDLKTWKYVFQSISPCWMVFDKTLLQDIESSFEDNNSGFGWKLSEHRNDKDQQKRSVGKCRYFPSEFRFCRRFHKLYQKYYEFLDDFKLFIL